MSPRWMTRLYAWPGFPRVSGDEPTNDLIGVAADLFSPRERGVSPTTRRTPSSTPCFPRVSGDEPWTAEGAQKHTTFSLCERG